MVDKIKVLVAKSLLHEQHKKHCSLTQHSCCVSPKMCTLHEHEKIMICDPRSPNPNQDMWFESFYCLDLRSLSTVHCRHEQPPCEASTQHVLPQCIRHQICDGVWKWKMVCGSKWCFWVYHLIKYFTLESTLKNRSASNLGFPCPK